MVFRDVRYSALGFTDAFTLKVAGPADASSVVLFLAGVPDGHEAFQPLAASLAEKTCLCAVAVPPQYDRVEPLRAEGFNFEEIDEVYHVTPNITPPPTQHPDSISKCSTAL